MDILNNKHKQDSVSRTQIENVEQEKQEYKLIGKYLRRKGLTLYCYNFAKDELTEVDIIYKDTVHMIPSPDGGYHTEDLGLEEAIVDSRNEHFEALNLKNAEKRVRRYKAGHIKELCNLRVPSKDGIKFY